MACEFTVNDYRCHHKPHIVYKVYKKFNYYIWAKW